MLQTLLIKDTAGEEKYAGLSSFYCRGASAAILAYDLTRYNTLNVLKERHIPLLQSADENCLCVVVGTKLDLVNDTTRQVSTDVGKALAKSQNKGRVDQESSVVPYFETSSKTGKNVEDVFSFILNTCLPLGDDCGEKMGRKLSGGCVDLHKPKNCPEKRKCC